MGSHPVSTFDVFCNSFLAMPSVLGMALVCLAALRSAKAVVALNIDVF